VGHGRVGPLGGFVPRGVSSSQKPRQVLVYGEDAGLGGVATERPELLVARGEEPLYLHVDPLPTSLG